MERLAFGDIPAGMPAWCCTQPLGVTVAAPTTQLVVAESPFGSCCAAPAVTAAGAVAAIGAGADIAIEAACGTGSCTLADRLGAAMGSVLLVRSCMTGDLHPGLATVLGAGPGAAPPCT